MAVTLPTSITGSAQTGFTTPGYTTVVGAYPGVNGKQNYVSALTGTQAGVRVHSVSDPFTVAVYQPVSAKMLGTPVNGVYTSVPVNVYGFNVRKGLIPAASQAAQIGMVDCKIRIPAGSDGYDSANVRAMLSAAIGALTSISAGLGDTCVSGQL